MSTTHRLTIICVFDQNRHATPLRFWSKYMIFYQNQHATPLRYWTKCMVFDQNRQATSLRLWLKCIVYDQNRRLSSTESATIEDVPRARVQIYSMVFNTNYEGMSDSPCESNNLQ